MRLKLLLLLSTFVLMAGTVQAEVKINGFASIVMGIDLEGQDDGDIPREGYGDRTVDNLQESRVALQWSADLDDGIRFVGQTMARGDSGDGFVLGYDWAYFDFNVGDSGKLKFGRVRIPFYKYSDYLDVGSAYHWVTPPPAMYTLSFSNVDGIGYQQNFSSGSLDHSLNLVVGRYQGELSAGGTATPSELENFLAINWSGTFGNHEFYTAYAQADVYIYTDLSALAAGVGAPADELNYDGDLGTFIGVGYKGTFGDYGVFAEWSEVEVEDSIAAESTIGYYIGGSYTMNDYTFHLTYEAQEDEADSLSQYGAAASLAEDIFATEGEFTAIIAGVRKDIGVSSSIKTELTSFTEKDFSGDLTNLGAGGSVVERDALILKVAIETMF